MVNSDVDRRRGRPRGASDTRERLIQAARSAIEGGEGAAFSARAIAREVGVSHTLVNYHFGSLAGLRAAAFAVAIAPHTLVVRSTRADGTVDIAALARAFLGAWEHPRLGPHLAAQARRVASSEAYAAAFSTYLESAVFGALVGPLGVAPARRAALAFVGTVFARYVLRVPIVADLDTATLVRQLTAMVAAPR
ncbi:TetR family transcriptional regulator [uncultured Microbacterium sp.]|uniref:TetR/AcrR family transcriptional regulator n=1 Tax=uncultured Microbacterium sp. TaxID=191216 RepID=UPI0025D981BE|nr:TetR family transcriptional regulator [uncultured Microbacterium sp.]